MFVAGLDSVRGFAGEFPVGAGDDRCLALFVVLDVEDGVGVVEVRGPEWPMYAIGKEPGLC